MSSVKRNKLIRSALFIMLVILVPFIASAISGINASGNPAAADGRIRVLISTPSENIRRPVDELYGPIILNDLITHSEMVRAATDISADGTDVLTSRLWATQAEHNVLIAAENAARSILTQFPQGWFIAPPREVDRRRETTAPNYALERNDGVDGAEQMLYDFSLLGFARGEEFDLCLVIEGNTGFNSMFLNMVLPPQLELISLTPHVAPPPPPPPQNPFEFHWYQTGNSIIAGWVNNTAGQNYQGGELMTYRLRVRNDAALGLTPPITLAFRNRLFFDTPTAHNGTVVGRALSILLPGTPTVADPRIFDIGGVLIR
jgi:hypothetical protein